MCNVSSLPGLLIKSPAAHKYVNFMFNYFTSLHILPVPITNQISLYSPPSMIIFLLTLFSHEKNRLKAVEAIHTSMTSCGHPLESLNTGTATHYGNIIVILSAQQRQCPFQLLEMFEVSHVSEAQSNFRYPTEHIALCQGVLLLSKPVTVLYNSVMIQYGSEVMEIHYRIWGKQRIAVLHSTWHSPTGFYPYLTQYSGHLTV